MPKYVTEREIPGELAKLFELGEADVWWRIESLVLENVAPADTLL